MPIRYAVDNTSEETVVIDGLGVIPPKTEIEFSEERIRHFELMRGLTLTQVHVPETVAVTIWTSDN